MEDVLLLSDDVHENIKFTGRTAKARFESFKKRKVIGERFLDEKCFRREELAWMYQRGWKELATVETPCNVGWCHEMMANFRSGEDDENEGLVFRTHFRGTQLVLTPARVRDFLGIPEMEEDVMMPDGYDATDFVGIQFGFVTPGATEMQLISELVCKEGTVWTRKRCPKSVIRPQYFCLLESSFTNLYPGSGTEVSEIRAAFMYAVLKGWRIDIAAFIIRAWRTVAQSSTSGRSEHKIPFPRVLCALATTVSPDDWPGVYREGRLINTAGRNRSAGSMRATQGAKRQKSAASSSASVDEDDEGRAFRCEMAGYSDRELQMEMIRQQRETSRQQMDIAREQTRLQHCMSYGQARLQYGIDSLSHQMSELFQYSGHVPSQLPPFVYQPPVYPDFTPATGGPPTGSGWYDFSSPPGPSSSHVAPDADDEDED